MKSVALVLAVLATQMPPGISRTQVLDNPTVMVARLTFEPGGRETPHTHRFSALLVGIWSAEIENMLRGQITRESHKAPGWVTFIPREAEHAAANVGTGPFAVVTVAIKPDRKPGGAAPPSDAPPGITRTVQVDNDEIRATRVSFKPDAREPVHTHPYDLLLVQLTSGRMEVLIGSEKKVADYKTGDVIWLPRDVPHAVASAHHVPFEIMSVAIK